MKIFFALSKKIAVLLSYAGAIAILSMMLLVVADVATKYLFNDPIDGTTAIVASYFMVALVFLPLAAVTISSGHLFVELFTQKMTPKSRHLLDLSNDLIILAYLLFISVCTSIEAIRRTKEGEAWETAADLMPVWPSRWFLPLGLAAMATVIIYRIFRHFQNKQDLGHKSQ
jgi:TRAP-type C4-dicarboxylate transport system permease small subunit